MPRYPVNVQMRKCADACLSADRCKCPAFNHSFLPFLQSKLKKEVGIGWFWWVFVGIFHTHHYQIRNSRQYLRFALCSMGLAKQSIILSFTTLQYSEKS